MRLTQPRLAGVAVAVVAVALAAGCATHTATPSAAGGADVKIGIITGKTGPLAAYGGEYLDGLTAGLAYVTHGTGKINGHKIDLIVDDDADNPTTAVSDAKDLIGKGVTILGGSVDSAIALQVAAVAGQNKALFIAGPGGRRRARQPQPLHVPLRPGVLSGHRRPPAPSSAT